MNRSFLLVVLLIALVNAANEVQESEIKVTYVDDISKYDSKNLIPLEKLTSTDTRFNLQYTLGRRISGDRLVASGGNRYNYPTLQDVRLQLTYPASGTGAIISFVQINVEQSSNIGNAYVVSGGIGQRRISILVEAKSTSYFAFQALFFGY